VCAEHEDENRAAYNKFTNEKIHVCLQNNSSNAEGHAAFDPSPRRQHARAAKKTTKSFVLEHTFTLDATCTVRNQTTVVFFYDDNTWC
jgi:hypothetical protein